ncbi:MAG TPA: hypothetical protein VGO55_15695 [Allosphingosinicella sp.]|jgi:hypothetical protein|nr:hypothetical protein [Allosphingosinicella sp.]
MQRVRIGLTGLAFVFLAVLLAAILIRRADDGAPVCNETDSPAPGLTRCSPDSNATGATPAAATMPAGPRR